jgi:hypothetical protein
MKRLIVLLVVLCGGLAVAGAFHYTHTDSISFHIVTTGDTAQVVKVTPSSAYDSCKYVDTLDPGVSGTSGTWSAPSWQSRAWALRLYVDSALNSKAYLCSLYVNGTKRAIAITTASSGYTTVAKIIDTLKYVIDNVTGVKDSVVCDDSTTFLLIRNKYMEIPVIAAQGAGAYRFKPSAGSGTTASRTHLLHFDTTQGGTTIARICDSMVAKINATAAISDTLLATDSTTFYTITSKIKGLAFRFKGTGEPTDTVQDTASLQLNVTSLSTQYDTIPLAQLYSPGFDTRGMIGRFIVSSPYTGHGFANTDTATIRLVTSSYGSLFHLDSTKGIMPCTLRVVFTGSTAGRDTLFKEALGLIVRVTDTASDTTKTIPVSVISDYLLKDK